MTENQAAFCFDKSSLVDGSMVRAWFEDPVAVWHYTRAVSSPGLWKSEQLILQSAFRAGKSILDMGCGTGRIALGLWKLGHRKVTGVDFSRPMIAQARQISRAMGCTIEFRVDDATNLSISDRTFDGVVFGFNGLMQIPARENRRRALRELLRVVVPGGRFVFSTLDRDTATQREEWLQERSRWLDGKRAGALREFGDRVFSSPEGTIFMHLPNRAEILEDLIETGWDYEEDHMRSELANEPSAVREFAEDCRFWIARRPELPAAT